MSSTAAEGLWDLLWYWFVAFVSAFLGHWTHIPPLLFYLVFGALLGNLYLVHRGEGIEFFSEFSITIVFFALGFEETVEHFLEGVRKAWGIALIGALVPFGCGYLSGYIFWRDYGWEVHLAIATAVTATAVSLTMVVLQSIGLAKCHAAMGIMTSAVLDDVGCLILVAILLPIIAGKSTPTVLGILWLIAKVVIFFIIIVFLHTVVLPDNVSEGCLSKIPFFRTYGAKHLLSFQRGDQVSLIIVTYALALGMVGVVFGFHPAVGAYFAGLILEESYFDLEDGSNTMERAKDTVGSASFMWLGPVFFVNLGAGLVVEGELLKTAIPQALGLFGILYVGQFLSASGAAKYVPGGFDWIESALVGFGMLGRAELYFVVLNEAKQQGVFDNRVFFPMAIAAMFMNSSLPISMSAFKGLYLRYHPIGTEVDQEAGGSPTTTTTGEVGGGGTPHVPKRNVSYVIRRGIGMGGVEMEVQNPKAGSRQPSRISRPQRSQSAMPLHSSSVGGSSRQPFQSASEPVSAHSTLVRPSTQTSSSAASKRTEVEREMEASDILGGMPEKNPYET